MSYQADEKPRPERAEQGFRYTVVAILAALLVAALWYGKDDVPPPPPRTIVLYAFSTIEEALKDGVFPAFQERWQAEKDGRVEFVSTFAGSGAITEDIVRRIPAEIAVLSSQLDAQRLVRRGVVFQSAREGIPHGGVLTRSPFVIVVREGNPKGITGFESLAEPGTALLHADPATSGGAQWAILAEYGSALRATGDRDRAYAQLLGTWRNVTAQVASARATRSEFERGAGDAYVTYEQDVIAKPSRERPPFEIVYPRSTIVSEQTAVKLERNVTAGQRALVDAFFGFLWSRQAQQIFVSYGFRSPIEELNQDDSRFRAVEEPFTLDDLGGPNEAEREILRGVFRDRVLSELDS